MKKIIILIIITVFVMSSCPIDDPSNPDDKNSVDTTSSASETPSDPENPDPIDPDPIDPDPVDPDPNKITLDYTKGSYTSSKILYSIWLSDENKSFIQYAYICCRLRNKCSGLSGTGLSYWNKNFRNETTKQTEMDAVTGATVKNSDFTISFNIDNTTIPRKFWIYFEVDHSYNSNDWFEDQPSIVYGVEIDLDNILSEYNLTILGWSGFEYCNFKGNEVSPTLGVLQEEIRYITHKRVIDPSNPTKDIFGDAYTNGTPGTNDVGTLKVTLE